MLHSVIRPDRLIKKIQYNCRLHTNNIQNAINIQLQIRKTFFFKFKIDEGYDGPYIYCQTDLFNVREISVIWGRTKYNTTGAGDALFLFLKKKI